MIKQIMRLCGGFTAGLVTLGLIAAISPTAVAGASAVFGGRATALEVTTFGIFGNTVKFADTGALSTSGGLLEASLPSAQVPGILEVGVLNASASGGGQGTMSESSTRQVSINAGLTHISAELPYASAFAVCTEEGQTLSAVAGVAKIVVNGQEVLATGEINQTINLPNGKIVINEQMQSSGSQDVTAMHVVINGVVDARIARAQASTACGGLALNWALVKRAIASGMEDFVTGGGFITNTPSGNKANFAVEAGIKNGSYWGHLTYQDHGTGMKVQSTSVTVYLVTGPTSRHVEGTAKINGQSGFTYAVDVTDNGEPGRNDKFFITLSNGYTAGGTLKGGNIQLHPGNTPPPPPPAVCGNAVVETGEMCDEGIDNGMCPETCSATCTLNICIFPE